MIRRLLRWWARRALDRELQRRRLLLDAKLAQDWLELAQMTRERPPQVLDRLKDQYAESAHARRTQIDRWYRREVAKIGVS